MNPITNFNKFSFLCSDNMPDTSGVALAASLNPQTKLLEMRRQMFTVQQSLEQGKRDSVIREAAFAQKEEQVRKRDLELQQTFIKMDSVVQENNAKKDRADRRGIEEARTASQKMKEIAEGQVALEELKQEVAQLEHSKSKLQKHHDFLSRYQSMNSQDFPEISTILDRFTMLQSAQKDLLTEQGRLLEEVEQKRRDLARLQKARSTHALNAENVTGKIRDRLEATRALGLRLLQGADEATAERAERINELGTTLLATNNLYFRCTNGPYGNVIKHHKNDAEALGVGAGKLGESLGFAPWNADMSKDDESSAANASEGKEHEGKDDLNTIISTAVKAGAAGDETAITKIAEAISGMAPEAVVEKLRKALSSLIVVGSYLVDYSAILNERSAWLNEQRRLREEKEEKENQAKEEEAEKQRQKEQRMAAAAAAASTKRGNATSSPSKGSSSVTAVKSPPPFSPIKTSTMNSSMSSGIGASGLSASASALLFGGTGSSLPGSAAAAAVTLNAIAAQGGIPGLGGKLAAALQKQGGPRTYVVSSSITLPSKIDAQVPVLSSKTIAILSGNDKSKNKSVAAATISSSTEIEDSKSITSN